MLHVVTRVSAVIQALICIDVLRVMSMPRAATPPQMDPEGALLGMSMTGMGQTIGLAQGSMRRAELAYQNMDYEEAEQELDRAEMLLAHNNMGIRVICSLYELGRAHRLVGARSDPSAGVLHQQEHEHQHRQLQPLHGVRPAQQSSHADLLQQHQQVSGGEQGSVLQEGAVGNKRPAAGPEGDTEGEPEVVSRRRRVQSAHSV